tara:strand:- start:2436 stop:3422 length:987 start_codon:yes stop_codon:yes gene_type:complete
MRYPGTRLRRNRKSEAIRSMVRENQLSPDDFMVPLFITEGENVKDEIPSMPGYFRHSLDRLNYELDEIAELGIRSVLLFVKVPKDKKDNKGTEPLRDDGLMQRAIKHIKEYYPDLFVISDVALDPYSSHGHDGIVKDNEIVNDISAELLAKIALSHANAGVDMVAPSDMMDGRVDLIRKKLDQHGYENTGIMAYSVKYASAFYGPFRDALDSAPGFGDKKTYQMDPANSKEALVEAQMDIQEGADIIMIKPGQPYLDILKAVSDKLETPVSVYHVSGEYSMIKAAAEKGWLNENEVIMESLISFKRAGASLIVTYFAKQAVKLLNESK